MASLPESVWDFAEQLRLAALPFVDQYFRAPDLAIEEKADVSPVTLADQGIERRWREMITATFPEHGIIGEEEDAVGADRDFVWVLDPIDGTRAFVGGFPLFTHLFALMYQGRPVFSGIMAPKTGEKWLGCLLGERKATFNDQPIVKRPSGGLAQSLLSATAPAMFNADQRQRFDALEAVMGDCRFGADAYAYGLTALGTVGVVAEASMKPWDFMALIPVLEASGGMITDWSGAPLGLESDGTVLAAATPALHAQALAVLAG